MITLPVMDVGPTEMGSPPAWESLAFPWPFTGPSSVLCLHVVLCFPAFCCSMSPLSYLSTSSFDLSISAFAFLPSVVLCLLSLCLCPISLYLPLLFCLLLFCVSSASVLSLYICLCFSAFCGSVSPQPLPLSYLSISAFAFLPSVVVCRLCPISPHLPLLSYLLLFCVSSVFLPYQPFHMYLSIILISQYHLPNLRVDYQYGG